MTFLGAAIITFAYGAIGPASAGLQRLLGLPNSSQNVTMSYHDLAQIHL